GRHGSVKIRAGSKPGSAGPIRTLAASGVGDFRKLMEKSARGAMLRRNVTQYDAGGCLEKKDRRWGSVLGGNIYY
ncbi:MAG TPA: hypothetical protein PK416_13235, partial [Thermodesulfobacteriota bacterium]|nr:hypothetical protein [Thermodesulfobacteriota bacterium]